MQCKDDVHVYPFDDFWDNDCQSCFWTFHHSLKCTRKYCVHDSICHLKFPKVVLAHILGEVGTFCIVKCFFLDMPTKNKLARFFDTRYISPINNVWSKNIHSAYTISTYCTHRMWQWLRILLFCGIRVHFFHLAIWLRAHIIYVIWQKLQSQLELFTSQAKQSGKINVYSNADME